MAASQRHSLAFGVLTLGSPYAEQIGAAVTAEQGATCARSYDKHNELCKDKIWQDQTQDLVAVDVLVN